MPRPRKPTEQKRRTGNPGKRPLPDPDNVVQLAPVGEIPAPHRPLQEPGMAAWVHASQEAGAWLAPSDVVTVLMYAEAVDDYTQLRDSLHRQGFDDVTMWRQRKQVIDFGNRVTRLAASLGLSPAARAQLRVAEVRIADSGPGLMERERTVSLMDDRFLDVQAVQADAPGSEKD